jgi:diguanylate cyclase (GGDEF)-like protein
MILALFLLSLYFNLRFWMAAKDRTHGDKLLIKQAYFNPITELPNRTNIEIVVAEQIDRSRRHDKSFVVGIVIIENYDAKFIRAASNLILESLRDEDILAHISDETFLILFNEYLEESNFDIILRRMKTKFDKKLTNEEGNSMNLKVLIGHSIYPEDASTIDDLIRAAKSEALK